MIKNVLTVLALLFCSAPAFSQINPSDILIKFFDTYKLKNSDEAVDYLFTNTGYADDMAEGIEDVKRGLKKQGSTLGLYYGRDSLSMRQAGPRFLKYTYLVRHARQPMLFHFTFYKPENRWQVYSFSFSTNVSEDLDEASKLYRLKENY